jgi:hypothetical protein
MPTDFMPASSGPSPGEREAVEQLKLDVEPKRLLILSEPYVRYTSFGYQPAVDVRERKSRRQYFLFVSASTLARPLELLRIENGGRLTGIEVWVRKEGPERTSKYVVEE